MSLTHAPFPKSKCNICVLCLSQIKMSLTQALSPKSKCNICVLSLLHEQGLSAMINVELYWMEVNGLTRGCVLQGNSQQRAIRGEKWEDRVIFWSRTVGSKTIDPFKIDDNIKRKYRKLLTKIFFEWYWQQGRSTKAKDDELPQRFPGNHIKVMPSRLSRY